MSVLLVLRDGSIARLWTALALSAGAAELFAIAVLWLATARDPALVASLPAVRAIVLLAATLLGERLARGFGLRRVLVLAVLAEAAAMLLGILPVGDAVWPLLLAVAAVATARAQTDPTIQAALPRLTADSLALLRANGLIDGTHRLARLVGPALVPLLLLVLPLEGLVVLAAAIGVIAALVLLGLPPLAADAIEAPDPGGAVRRAGLRAAAAAILAHPSLPVMLVLSFVTNALWVHGPILGWTLMLAQTVGTTAGPGIYGLMIASYAVTNLGMNLWVASRPDVPRFGFAYAMLLLYGLGVTLTGLLAAMDLARLPLLLAASALGGAGAPAKDLLLAVRMQRDLGLRLVGPAFRLRTALALAGWLVGAVTMPLLLAFLTPAAIVTLSGVGSLAVAAAGIVLLARPSDAGTVRPAPGPPGG